MPTLGRGCHAYVVSRAANVMATCACLAACQVWVVGGVEGEMGCFWVKALTLVAAPWGVSTGTARSGLGLSRA